MNLVSIGKKCPYRKATTATHDQVSGGIKTEDLTPIVGEKECLTCQFCDEIDNFQGFVNCTYPHKY